MIVVGRIREYNNEKYVIPEIIKKLDNMDWISLRNIELEKLNLPQAAAIAEAKTEEIAKNPAEDIYGLIRALDKGDGAPIEDVIGKSSGNAESIVNRLLESGDVFEVKPGRLKVLE